MRFVVENMHCGGCAKGVTATVKEADPSAQVEVQIDKKEILVSGGRLGSEALRSTLQAAGWKASAA
ncbi:heavy-metal-associated domain-containing protein [Roseomonas chloroacetimidivorans]|uniref:heavy-metal-associated domain-containing protein n=1 Tax=Roseomonas chloroacetimidivorans TaxID=1766656 RepID=UPI003C77377C